MSFLKLLLGIALMSAILFFAVLNLEETVDVRLLPDAAHLYRDVSFVVAMLFAYLLGIVTYILITLARDIRARAQVLKLQKENRALLDEVLKLRGSALDDLPTVEAVGGEMTEGRAN